MNTPIGHSHVFLGAGHEGKERKIWMVIWLSFTMMVAEIIGGAVFGSLALLADGVHMATHVAALAIAALAYRYARRHANDTRFAFGTGKFGDLASFASAIVLAAATLGLGWESAARFFSPVAIDIDEAILVAVLGLLVNIAGAWLLSGEDHHGHGHGHGHDHGHDHGHSHAHHHAHGPERRLDTGHGVLLLEIFEDDVPARFRLRFQDQGGFRPVPGGAGVVLELERPDGARERFALRQYDGFLESEQTVAEPHEFTVRVRMPHDDHNHDLTASFTEQTDHPHDHHHHRDNNYRAAFVHILADAGVSVLAIAGLLAAKYLGWVFMDPVMGIVGAVVIGNWSYGLIKDSGRILLDMTADQDLAGKLRAEVESQGDHVADLHLWRLGPGHLGAILSVVSDRHRAAEYYRCRFGKFAMLSHVTIETRAK